MKRFGVLLTIFLVTALTACVQSPPAELMSDAIPTDIPLPRAGVNQRPVTGEKTVLLVAARWAGDRVIDMSALNAGTFAQQPGSLNHYLQTVSMGKLILKGTTIQANFSTPAPTSGFYGEIAEAKTAALAQGYDPSKYDYFWVVHDNGIGGAEANMPGTQIVVRDGVYRYRTNYIWAHEFGHNLGYSHEVSFGDHLWSYVNCSLSGNVVFAPDTCETSYAGDWGNPIQRPYDISSLYPANYRWYSGWLDASQASVISESGLYRLVPLGTDGPHLYLINRKNSSGAQQISLEYRKFSPPYDNFTADNPTNGIWVRYTTMDRIVSNVQLDGTPDTATTADPALLPGKTLKDSQAGITIEVCSASGTGVTVAVAVIENTANLCKTLPLLPPVIQAPAPQAPAVQNPIVFSGISRPGALINVSYRLAGGNNWKDVKITADATGSWKAPLPTLPAANYNGQVWQTIGNRASLATFRNFGVSP